MDIGTVKDGLVVFRTAQVVEVRATLLRLTRYDAAFEVYSAEAVIRTSEVLEGFTIFLRDQPVYAGRAVVQNFVNTGTATVCSVVLDDVAFDGEFFAALGRDGKWRERFEDFLRQWQAICKVLPEFKVASCRHPNFPDRLRQWMEQMEFGIRSSPRPDRVRAGAGGYRSVVSRKCSCARHALREIRVLSSASPTRSAPSIGATFNAIFIPLFCAPHLPTGVIASRWAMPAITRWST